MATFANLAYAMLRWFETINKPNLILNEPKTRTFESNKSKQIKKKRGTYDNGHF
jgi:hypothetical protein